MTKELKKRVITSILLFIIVIFCISVNKIIFGVALLIVFIKCFQEWIKINLKYFKKKFSKYLLVKFFGFIYLFIFLVSAFLLRGDNFDQIIFFIIILCICICSDIGGYFFGKAIGGKKLTKISPNKTLSGAVGSFIFSMLPLLVNNFQKYIDINFDLSLKNIIFCLIISLACQLGDLFISYFKRLNNVKDTGRILPGHGGLLDRVDGIIFAIPLAYILKFTQIF